jgi:DNA-binding NarL/FixJ family response regulator
MSPAIRVAIVDDHPFFRDGVKRALRRVKDIEFAAEGASAADACQIADEIKPDILLLDITMPGGGIEATRTIAEKSPGIGVIILTGADDDAKAEAALDAGAAGFLLKGVGTLELLEAVRCVHGGRPYITPAVSSRLVLNAVRSRRSTRESIPRHTDLNHREQEILNAAIEGLTNAEIARRLDLALPTVKNYMSRIFEKLNVRNRAEAIAVSLRKE